MTLSKSVSFGDKAKMLLGGMGRGASFREPSMDTDSTATRSISSESQKQAPQDAITSTDEMFLRLRREAADVAEREPILCALLTKIGLLDNTNLPDFSSSENSSMMVSVSNMVYSKPIEPAKTFEEVIARIVSHRLSSCSGGSENFCPKFLRHLIEEAFASEDLELGHTMSESVREDAMAILRRDPACETLLEAVLFMKGFLSLVIHRAARRAWKPEKRDENDQGEGDNVEHEKGARGTRFVSLLFQSMASSAFGVDIHPAAQIGAGVMIDHASGVVIGETATVGDGCTILHGVTLGGTGKDSGDRHPKIGKDVMIGAGTKILGNIRVGDRAKIGAGSVVLRTIPTGATAVGSPARIIGFTPKDERPGSTVDMTLLGVEPLVKSRGSTVSNITESTVEETPVSIDESDRDKAVTIQKIHLKDGQPAPEADEDTEESTKNEEEIVTSSSSENGDSNEEEDDDDEDEEETEEEEDNKLTTSGKPAKCCWKKPPPHCEEICPFRNAFASTFCKDSISHTKLRSLLIQQGCTEDEIVEVYFELLHRVPASSKARQTGCIPVSIFATDFPQIAKEKTNLDWATCQALAKGDMTTLAMSKKASRRFSSLFVKLGKNASEMMTRRLSNCSSGNVESRCMSSLAI